MTGAAWLQIAALIALVLVGTRLLGPYLAQVYGGGRAPGDRVFLPVERALYRFGGVDPGREQQWPRLCPVAACLQRGFGRRALPAPTGPGRAAAQSDGRGRRAAGARLQHRRQLRHEHELAELRRRGDDEPPDADGRADGAELRFGRGRDLGRDRASSAASCGASRRRSATSGSTSSGRRLASCCRSRSWSRCCS